MCAPVLISLAGRHAEPAARASAVSIVTTLAYLGFLVGPAVVGLAADALSLRAALGAVAGLSLVLAGLVRMAPGAPSGATAPSREKHRGEGFPSGPDPCSAAEPTE